MSATTAFQPRPLLLACVAGLAIAAIAYTALITPWLGLMVLEPDQFDWLTASTWLQRLGYVFRASLMTAAIFSPFVILCAAFIERRWPHSLHLWLLAAIAGAAPLALIGLGMNMPFDCAYNCEPSLFRNLILIGSPFAAGICGALVAWLVRYGGRGAT
jgi:hypothetical protein